MSLFLKPCKTVLASLALVAGMFLMQGAPAVYAAETQTSANVPELTPGEIDARKKLKDIVRETRAAFDAAMREGRIKPEEFELLDFTQPDEEGYGDNVAFEVLNPDSPRSIVRGKSEGRFIPQEILDELTTSKDAKVVFNLRRSNLRGYTFDELKLVINHVKEGVCKRAVISNPKEIIPYYRARNKTAFAENNHEVFLEEPFSPLCVQSVEAVFITLDSLVSRFRKQEDQSWIWGLPPNPYDDSANPF